MKSKIITIILIIACLLGLGLLLYPSVADYWNNSVNAQQINFYRETLQDIDEDQYREIWQQALEYNQLLSSSDADVLAQTYDYNKMLCIGESKIMGYIEIPMLDVTLTVSHGTEEDVLSSGVGHIEWSSLPVGGVNTHSVLSAHRGLPSAKLFTDLDKLREGELFILNILNETLTYEVDQIRTVDPDDLSDLCVVPNQDYCTLVTCTPYGVNTHRLLVRGHRVENVIAEARVISEAVVIDEVIVASFVAFPVLFGLLLVVLFKKPEKKVKLEDIRDSVANDQ